MAHGFRKFISEVFVNGKFQKILPSENFPLYGTSLPFNCNYLQDFKHYKTKSNPQTTPTEKG